MLRFNAVLKKAILIIPMIASIVLIMLIVIFNKVLIIFPHVVYGNRITTYADHELGGKSEIIDFAVLKDKIILTYTLGKNPTTSFAGLFFDLSFINVSLYDYMELQIYTTSPVQYLVTFMSFIEGKTRMSELNTIASYAKAVELVKDRHIYRINLNELMGVAGDQLNPARKSRPGDFSRLLFLHLKELVKTDNDNGDANTPFYATKTIVIEKISFHRSYTLLIILMAAGIIVYYAAYFLFSLFLKKKQRVVIREKQELPRVQLNVETYREADTNRILDIIRESVFDPDFSIHTINDRTGLPENKISRLIEEQYNLSFKQFINQIRLNEARRLLLESDLKVYDIAFKTGYNDNAYFCRLFKKYFGITPNEWRRKNGES